MQNFLMQTYARKDIAFTHGEGVWLFDQQGKRYLDALSGIAVCGLGHAHPEISKTICDQAGKLLHTSNIYRIEQQEQLGERLCSVAKMDYAFFCNSGAEANEAAIKIARLHGHQKNIERPEVMVFENSFHGRTLATLSATDGSKAHAGFEPLVDGFVRAPFNQIEAVTRLLDSHPSICAILIEPIQGEGGIHVPDADFLKHLRELCDQRKLLLMFDEIQTGVGRTGKWYAADYFNARPDVMTTAKALGNGVPIGACLANKATASMLSPGMHGSTFGGNPLACAAANTVLTVIESENLLSQVSQHSEYFLTQLNEQLTAMEVVHCIRGAGYLIGIELNTPCAEIVDIALQNGLLVNVTAGNVIRMLPPYIMSHEQLDQVVDLMQKSITQFMHNQQTDRSH